MSEPAIKINGLESKPVQPTTSPSPLLPLANAMRNNNTPESVQDDDVSSAMPFPPPPPDFTEEEEDDQPPNFV